MPNVVKVLKAEISRIGRKESKAAVTPLHRRTVRFERAAADLKRRTSRLEKENRLLQARLAKLEQALPTPAPAEKSRAWITGRGIRSLRRKLGLSQDKFAKLAGVSGQGVYQWERKGGMLRLRADTKAAIMAVRGLGAREARRRLEGMKGKRK